MRILFPSITTDADPDPELFLLLDPVFILRIRILFFPKTVFLNF